MDFDKLIAPFKELLKNPQTQERLTELAKDSNKKAAGDFYIKLTKIKEG